MGITRRVEKIFQGSWLTICMLELKVGDIFRMFEPDGKAVGGLGTSWIVTKDAKKTNGIAGVMCEVYS